MGSPTNARKEGGSACVGPQTAGEGTIPVDRALQTVMAARQEWHGPRGPIPLAESGGIIGIVNLTPDSFYDGGRHADAPAGLDHARRLLAEGADVVDLGGESSRPGSAPVTADTEQARVLPVLKALLAAPGQAGPVVSVDTWRASTAAAALEAGATIVNDISATAFDPGLVDVLVQYRPAYVLMHCQGTPATMQAAPHYDNVCEDVAAFFEREMARLVRAGLPEENILLDPGIGFGKKACHNLALMAHPESWSRLGRPSLMALSMKTVFGDLLGLPMGERGTATQVATALCAQRGYLWHRVHEVKATRETLKLALALRRSRPDGGAGAAGRE